MVRRPQEWKNWTQEERMAWLRKQRTRYNGGRKRSLRKKDKERVWNLLKKYDNQSLVADLLGCDRTTLYRFLQKNPIPISFVLKEDVHLEDYPEIKIWLKRMQGFAKQVSINNYLVALRKFYEHMKKNNPERARPSLWTSDDITEWVYSLKPNLWHWAIVPLRSLALKAQEDFPSINLGLLPTKKTHKAKRSLAGKEEYYYTPDQVNRMIEVATTKKAKALIAFLYNLAPRTTALTNVRIENVALDKRNARIKDKGAIWWDTHGMTDKTRRLLLEYLEERDYPRSGWLFVNGNGNGIEKKMTSEDVNDIAKEVGDRAGIKGKVLTAKAFRKSLVENFMNIPDANPMVLAGSGKETKTCFCVGWSLDTLMKYYAPKMKTQIETHRRQFAF